MSEDLNRGIRDFSEYDSMDTEELEQILRLDAEAPEGAESDTELLLYVMEVLASRRNSANSTGNTAQEAWESFQQNYMPQEARGSEPGKKGRIAPAPWLRRLIAAAAIVALVVCIPLTAKAFSLEKLWDIFARWARETFSFVSGENTEISEPDTEYCAEVASFRKLLEESKRDATIIPTWIPEGFSLEKTERDATPVQEIYRARYINGERKLRISVRSYLEGDPEKVEINENLLECYEPSDVQYYIFSNNEQLQAVWIVDSYQCNISGDLSVDEIKQMIDSIAKG